MAGTMTDQNKAIREIARKYGLTALYGDTLAALREACEWQKEQAVAACVDMAERYDADIEGCDADQLIEYGEGITCSFRLAYIIKYGKFPPEGDAWSVEFVEQLKAIRRGGQ